MSFTLVKLVSMVLAPSAFLVLLAAAGLLLHRWWIGRAALCLGIAGLVVCLVFPVSTWLTRPLENRFPQVTELPPHVDGVIVLGGALDELLSEDRGTPTFGGAPNRITSFMILARRYPQAKLVFTGGSGRIEQGASEAYFVRVLLNDLGMDTSRIIFEDRSRTTYENAVMSRALVQPKPGEVWLLVTSAIHMPRSVGVFRQAGWPVLPFPVGYRTRDHIPAFAPSLGEKLASLDWAAHEWEGLIAYWIAGEANTLLPAP